MTQEQVLDTRKFAMNVAMQRMDRNIVKTSDNTEANLQTATDAFLALSDQLYAWLTKSE